MGKYGNVRKKYRFVWGKYRFVKVVTMGRVLVFDTSGGKANSAATPHCWPLATLAAAETSTRPKTKKQRKSNRKARRRGVSPLNRLAITPAHTAAPTFSCFRILLFSFAVIPDFFKSVFCKWQLRVRLSI